MFFPNLLSTRQSSDLTLLHSEQSKLHRVTDILRVMSLPLSVDTVFTLHRVLGVLSVIGLNNVFALVCEYCIYFAGFANIG